jgi:hypothetical protein
MAFSNVYDKMHFTCNATDWTPIVATISGSYFGIKNKGDVDVRIRVRVNDPNTEDTLAPGAQEGLTVPTRLLMTTVQRFTKGDTLMYAQSTSGTVDLVGTFVS